jgi:hypothetical protein
MSGGSAALQAYEASFHQDLNGDGVISGSPVILDLDGNGVNLSPLGASKATFDVTGDGQRVQTAWTGSGDGFLAIDLDEDGRTGADGVIDQSKEIVFTQWASGSTSDMQALRQVFDTNHNRQLDSGDTRWSEFRIWQDANSNGTSDPGEVETLDHLGIISVDLSPIGPAQQFTDGSAIQGLSTFSRADGTTGVAADVSLAHGSPTLLGDASTVENTTGANADIAFHDDSHANAYTSEIGHDIIVGGGRGDTFVFRTDLGHVTIESLGTKDLVQFDHMQFTKFAAAPAYTAEDGNANTVITIDPDHSVTLDYLLKASLSAAEFHIV